MKSIVGIIIVVIFVLALLFVGSHRKPPKKHVTLPNNHSPRTSEIIDDPKPKKDNKNPVKPIVSDVVQNETLEADTEENKEKEESEVSYITAYRDWQYFQNCYTDIEDFHNDKDPLDTLAERFANNPRESQIEPTPQQNMYYQHHVDICKGMIDDETDNYYQVMQKLQQRFEKIAAITDEEKQLEHALQMAQHLGVFNRELLQASLSKSGLSANDISTIDRQVKQLTTAIMEIYDGSEVLSEEDTQFIQEYSDEIDRLHKKIANSKTIDEESIIAIEAQIDGYLNSIDDYLHRVQSADAFLVLASKLYKSEYFQKDSSIIKTLKNSTGIYDSYYINTLNQLVFPLVACSMNYPCDAESDYILSYCLGLKDSMFNQACGLGLEDFYFSFYIGANQLNDVNNYFSFLVNRYAQ